MVRFADTGDEQRTALAEGLRDALGGDDFASDRRAGPIDNPGSRRGGRCVAGARGLVGVRLRSSSVAPSAHPNGWDDFDAEVITHPVLGQTRCLFAEAANAIRRME
jgi:hypothetical protein